MIRYCLYVIGGLLLIYPRSTNQGFFYQNKVERIQELLREEKSGSDGSSIDIACGELKKKEKESVCNKVMELIISLEHNIGLPRAESFKNKKSKHPVPQLANKQNPLTCNEIPIEGLDMDKNMFWCKHEVWQEGDSDEIHAQGFFISSGRKVLDSAFIFRPSPTNNRAVTPLLVLEKVDLFMDKIKAHKSSSSSGKK